MRRLISAVLITVLATCVAVAAQGRGNGGNSAGNAQGKGGGNQQPAKGNNADNGDRDAGSAAVHVSFGTADVETLRTHYAPRYRSLPPGLQKKLARTGTLPPGWQKKLEPFPVELERRFGVLPTGYLRGVYDGNAVIVNARSGALIDVAALF